ncbi:MAG: hypothetical protein CVU96_07600 [Firmicutes bacterium HGW-Firmicutes-20]|nr:MAG: hypothetical protein CVU96_07600 [Firmicutes bacterium HGW-Firmicutes-20]PKM86404.1 MAG: hypothetical protein CVU85_08050 [Firmicutes bacterium HGW-Firmicutes-10]
MNNKWIKLGSVLALGAALTMPLVASAVHVQAISVEDMLVYAMQDEVAAKAEYEALIEEYGSVRPFTNILRAELRHIDALTPLLEAYGVDIGDFVPSTNVPASLDEAYQIGVDAETKNIALYQTYLASELPEDVAAVFNRLATASTHHLEAFQRQLDNEGTGNQRGPQGRGVQRGAQGQSAQRGNFQNTQAEDCIND